MTTIGTFTKTKQGYEGRLHTLSIECEIALVPAQESTSDNAPDFRVMAGNGDDIRDVGAGWKHKGEKAGAFVAVSIDDPALPHPLRANLFEDENESHTLVWSRASRRDSKG